MTAADRIKQMGWSFFRGDHFMAANTAAARTTAFHSTPVMPVKDTLGSPKTTENATPSPAT